MTVARQGRRGDRGGGGVLLVHDAFSGSGAVMGRSADTVDNGEVYENSITNSTTENLVTVVAGFAQSTTTALNVPVVETFNTDVHIVAQVLSLDAGAFSDNIVLGRVLPASGIFSDAIYTVSARDTNINEIIERSANVQIQSASYLNNWPENVLVDVVISLVGDKVRATTIQGATTKVLNLTGLIPSVCTKHGFWLRGTGGLAKSMVCDFKVYTATDIDYTKEITL